MPIRRPFNLKQWITDNRELLKPPVGNKNLYRLATQRTRLPLPWAQARLLSTIEDQGEARISDLAYLDHCSQPTMTTQVRRLEDAGLVSRTTDPGDARAVLIRITQQGRQTLEQARADRAAAINPRLERLSAEERRTLVASVGIIRKLLTDVDEHPIPHDN